MNQPRESVRQKLRADIAMWQVAWEKDFSPTLVIRLCLFEAGFQFTFLLRMVEAARRLPWIGPLIAICLAYWTNIFFACDIAKRCTIGGGLFIPHPNGIVVGADVQIGRNVTVSHQTTIGRSHAGKHTSPTIKDGAYIGPGVKVLGGIVIGEGATLGANAVVLADVPANCVAVGVPARIITPASQA